MTAVVIMVVAAFAIALLLAVSRMGSQRRRVAREDLAREQSELVSPDILSLVREEAIELGVDRIPGADELDITIRLRVWHRDSEVREDCAGTPQRLRFEIAERVASGDATEEDVRLVCDLA